MLLQPITVPFSKSTLKRSVYTLTLAFSVDLCMTADFIDFFDFMQVIFGLLIILQV